MQTEASAKMAGSVVGTFRGAVDAERALDALRELGIPTDRVSMVMGEANVARDRKVEYGSEKRGTNVAGGAATGAALGAVLGILWGWIAGAGVLQIPGAVGEVSAGILSTTITGLAISAAIGGLIGALVGVGMPEVEPPEGDLVSEGGILVTVLASGAEAAQARETLRQHGAVDVRSFGLDPGDEIEGPQETVEQDVQAGEAETTIGDDAHEQEVEAMSAEESSTVGRDPNSLTGTKDDIDPETGVLGTAGTPMTTGYGVSGSTVGTGTSQGRVEQESEDFRGALPDVKSYEQGGRGSTDSPDRGMEHDIPVDAKYQDSRIDEAPVPSEPETRDIYEAGPSYGESPRGEETHSDATGQYRSADVHTSPTYGSVETEGSQASAGTDIPGSSDYRGKGDNTDEPD